MLVLSRRLGEGLLIGDDILVTVQEIRDARVRLGITAPREVPVHRREVQDRIGRERLEQVARDRIVRAARGR